ncbi:hypothetical protein CPB83DRAFT_753504 [Crepidotus variabilis]|uniref:DH domain-containing protein n=1 Tax=Crepidotus variabilis TaxID=179855 RepID=A0A9P6ETD3_9AGAR|nr:hypothetical protein CPB83DRAFT_753504 [Crepidotus variabilis]
MQLPDPSHYPDPYPFRPPHHHLASSPVPALSSTASSSASTRSSAYTSSGSALAYVDYSNVHVASGDEDHVGVGITTDSVVQMLANDPAHSTSARGPIFASRTQDHSTSRWSGSYSDNVRSRSSSIGNGNHEASSPPLSQKPSYDVSWQTVDEKDETAMSEDETDDEQGLDHLGVELNDNEEPTSAALIAEEGRGLIVQGDNTPVIHLHVQPGTTHLLIGSSTTPNAVPTFLTNNLPQIAQSLLALDISANFLGALPPVLAVCENLEELNVASNPLRVLPVFLADLINLRVLIADSTGITTLPDTLVDLDKLHTISIRRNKLHALPSWLCLLPALQTLCVDGNPFQGPWKALVDPLLAKIPATPVYPPSTPQMPLSAAQSENEATDTDEFSDHEITSPGPAAVQSQEEEDQTITPDRAQLGRPTAPYPLNHMAPPLPQSAKPLARTRTTPNRSYFDQTRAKSSAGLPSDLQGARQSPPVGRPEESHGHNGEPEVRRMKSAGDLRRPRTAIAASPENELPQRPGLLHYPTSLSSSNLLSTGSSASPSPAAQNPNVLLTEPIYPKRFASLGPNSQLAASTSIRPQLTRPMTSTGGHRRQLSQSMWDGSGEEGGANENGQILRSSSYNAASPKPSPQPMKVEPSRVELVNMEDGKGSKRVREKNSRWGFLKKMSMGKMKPDSPTSTPSPSPNPPRLRSKTASGSPPKQYASLRTGYDRMSKSPQIDLRFSTSGMLDGLPVITAQPPSASVTQPPSPSPPTLTLPSFTPAVATSNGFLAPSPTPRATKRRSFLPLDAPGQMSLSIPENSKFVSGVVVSHEADDASGPDGARGFTPSPVVDHDHIRRKEEERARDAYMRALRSVMAYLKDMNDLSQVQQQSNPLSIYGSSDDASNQRARRPTMVDSQRESSFTSSGGSTADSSQLRSSESIAGLRSGTSSQTLSVATTDSNGSQEERKFKDDKGKRAMVIREIVATERTYVKGMQELVDIYIQPACSPVNVLSGGKDSVVPVSERKVVFGSIEPLFSFHKDSFLPALEGAAAPLMRPSAEFAALDSDGQLSLNVAKAVGNIFVKHAAFMRMYSTYINNFDSSVQRVKYWTSDKYAAASTSGTLSPSSSTAQLVGLGLSMAMAPNLAENLPSSAGIPNLTSSQRKRIKTYLKRCRLNPRHTQLNLEGYLLLPVQRIPRYKLLLEELVRSTPPPIYEYLDDPLDRALSEIAALASNMNEGKRESESRRKLVRWQSKIRGKFPSPLVQPHRRLIMDGPLLLTRVVRKAVVSFEAFNAQGDSSTVQVDCLAPELTPRPLVGILCNDLLVLCRDPSEGQDPSSPVDLWAVLRMQTLPQPASIVHGNALRLVDNKAILYFDAPSTSDALNWYRAINLHIPASKAG